MWPPITAVRRIEAPPEAVYGFLAHLPNHHRFADGRLVLLALAADGNGARITLRGPLGIRRTAETTVTDLSPDHLISGTAAVGRRTSATVRWTVRPDGDTGCLVALTATVHRLGPLDALLMGAGGRRWLRRAFQQTIEALATALAAAT